MATDGAVALAKSASREILEMLLSPGGARHPLPDLEEIRKILELGQERRGQTGGSRQEPSDAR
jgi:hypothetical protein